jgi:ATP-dependent DNA helicase RecG
VVHREFTNAFPATFTIYSDRVETVNANVPNGVGPISADKFAPFPKNPAIAKFFIQLGRVEELGSGILNVNKYLAAYSPGNKPEFIEANEFKTIIPLSKDLLKAGDTVIDTVIDTVTDTVNQLLKKKFSIEIIERLYKIISIIYKTPGLRSNMIAATLSIDENNIRRDIRKLQELNLIFFKGAPKTGGYFITDEFQEKFKE